MGRAHYLRNELREAIGYYRQVLASAQDLGDEDLLAIPSILIARVLGVQGHFGKSGCLVAQAIGPLERAGNWPEWVGRPDSSVCHFGRARPVCSRGDRGATRSRAGAGDE